MGRIRGRPTYEGRRRDAHGADLLTIVGNLVGIRPLRALRH
jgi:hypothetical protein